MNKGSLFSVSSPAFVICCLVDDRPSDRCEGDTSLWFWFAFLWLPMLSSFSPAICMSPLGKCLFRSSNHYLFIFKHKFIYFNWSLITFQYCIGFAIHQHESAMGVHIRQGVPCHEPPSHLPPHPIRLDHPSASAPSILSWTGDLFHIWYYTCFNAILQIIPSIIY